MEPDTRYVETFIRPLLDAPGSTYRHTTLTGAHPRSYWSSYLQLQQDPALFPSRPALPVGDPKRRQLDTSVLVIGNLARRYNARRVRQKVEFVPLILRQMANAAMTNGLLHQAGLVRMLWWVPDHFKAQTISASFLNRGALTLNIDAGAQLAEVAGVEPLERIIDATRSNWTMRKRLVSAEVASDNATWARMRESGLSVPKGREILPRASAALNPEVDAVSPFQNADREPAELEQAIKVLQERIKDLSTSMFMKPKRPGQKEIVKAVNDLKYPQSIIIGRDGATKAKNLRVREIRVCVAVDLVLQVLNLEANLKNLEDRQVDGSTTQQLTEKLVLLDQTVDQNIVETLTPDSIGEIADLVDHQVSSFTTPPLLSIDRRPYMALKAEETDFWPRNGLALLDMTPHPTDFSVPDLANNNEGAKLCAELLKHLMSHKTKSLKWALDLIAPNAGRDLTAAVPEIRDARFGGRLNPEKVRVRMLNEAMLRGLARAYMEWPFKPESWELALTSGESEMFGSISESEEKEEDEQ
jgi:mitochondrial transcription factor 1